ncbi:hypothetical protein BH24ACI3_BH24ACI3_05630 [soil metagenome]
MIEFRSCTFFSRDPIFQIILGVPRIFAYNYKDLEIQSGFVMLKPSLLILLLSVIAVNGQTSTVHYKELYSSGKFDQAEKVLRTVTRSKSATPEDWYYLGLSQTRNNKLKDAESSFKRAIKASPNEAKYQLGLAYALFLRGDSKAESLAKKVIKLNPNAPDAYYILGMLAYRTGTPVGAYRNAVKAISLDPEHSAAYLLKAESLILSFGNQIGTVVKMEGKRNVLLEEAIGDLETYLAKAGSSASREYAAKTLEAVRLFSEYYGRDDMQLQNQLEPQPEDPRKTPLKVLSKPRPSYTDRARSLGVVGTARVLLLFDKSGNIEHILILQRLGYGLDEAVLAAARRIKFEPPTLDGEPYSTARLVEYSFSMY